jgi:DNA-binding transcriptional ArsR family regulator
MTTPASPNQPKKSPKGSPVKRFSDRTTDDVFRALSDESRRYILRMLHASGRTMTSKEISQHFESTWQTMSRHLGVLERAGLVSVEQRGRVRSYSVEKAHLQGVINQWMLHFEHDRLPVDDNAAFNKVMGFT